MQAKTLVFVMAVAALFISHAYGQTAAADTTAAAAGTTAAAPAAGTTAAAPAAGTTAAAPAAGTTAAAAAVTAAAAGTTAAAPVAGTTAAAPVAGTTAAAAAGTTAAAPAATTGVQWVALGTTGIVFQQYTNNVCNATVGANATHIPLSPCQVFTALNFGSTYYATGQQLSTSWFYFGVATTCSAASITTPAQVQIQNGACSWFNVTVGGVSNTVYVKAWWTVGSGGSTTAPVVGVTTATTTGAVLTTAAASTTSGASMLSVASSIAVVFVGLLAALMA